jgi:hypothetical protein
MCMPATNSSEIVIAFQQAMAQVLADPMGAERFRSFGAEPNSNTPTQFVAQFKADVALFADIIEKAKSRSLIGFEFAPQRVRPQQWQDGIPSGTSEDRCPGMTTERG